MKDKGLRELYVVARPETYVRIEWLRADGSVEATVFVRRPLPSECHHLCRDCGALIPPSTRDHVCLNKE